ncbi:glycoside hydrolase family 88 protein [Paenibacillus harenae]
MVMIIVSLIIVGLIAIIALIDAVPLWSDWFGRIRIGRYQNRKHWESSIVRVGSEWLNKTPKIKVTDNTRLVFIDMLRGNYTKSAIQQWQEAALLLGLSEQLKEAKDDTIQSAINQYLNTKFDSNGQWREKPAHVDGAILAYAIMKIDHVDPDRYKQALDYTWNMIREHIGEDGTVLYRKGMKDYRYVDTIGFICPFLVTYGLKYKADECIQLAVKQIQEYEKYGMLERHHIPCHAYQVKGKLPLGLYGWGRGLGWYAIGLIDAWQELPAGHEHKQALTDSVSKFARSALAFQRESGNWNWTVTRPESRADSSTTATLGWFLANAAKIGDISQECSKGANSAVDYLMKVTRRNGAVDFSQGDTKDIGVYAMLFNRLPFTQGFSMRLIAKIRGGQ